MVDLIQLLRNVGQFDSVTAGAQLPLSKLTLVYAENGRGKTTLAAILRSLSTGSPQPILQRHRLGASHPPHIVMTVAGAQTQFRNGAWDTTAPNVWVFDDVFVAENVCSGITLETEHRQNLHELILGAQGVSLNAALLGYVAEIEGHNRMQRARADAIPATARGVLTVDAFCALKADSEIAAKIQEAERNLAAAGATDRIRQHPAFMRIVLPTFDATAINALLAKGLPELESEAAARVQTHLARLGTGGEAWISDGMQWVAAESTGGEEGVCPFCVQKLSDSPLIAHYRTYFSRAYDDLKTAIEEMGRAVTVAHGGDIPAAFERAVRVATQSAEFWRPFTETAEVTIDTAAVGRAWKAARDAVLMALREKEAMPLEKLELSAAALKAIQSFELMRGEVTKLSKALEASNTQIALVKERAAVANVATLTADLSRLNTIAARHSAAFAPLCQDYLDGKAAKAQAEIRRDQAREALDRYRQSVFPAYEAAINIYLQRFNAGFRLGSVESVNTRAGSACSYNVLRVCPETSFWIA